ncbi:hypothetical protein [Paenibacillus apiarius]|uniref:hypothetical protein n=1 Tax=Paenibacillus apiarius TaxID=46240 RepID=UPI00198004C5|nr:hypothetical protein [Paenibacillus apiarius]MBN3527322.1 hypothetical protein [Paenibacillus apiarius]
MLGKQMWTRLMIASLLWIGGCGMPAAPADLIHPPLLEGNFHSDVLRSVLPEGSRLLVPLNGKGSNGISFGDVDGDGIDEAVIVYEENSRNDRGLKAALLKQEDEEWRMVWNTKGFGYGLDYAGIADVNKDGVSDIVLGWTLGAGEKGLEVYVWRNNAVELWNKKGYRGQFDFGESELSVQ